MGASHPAPEAPLRDVRVAPILPRTEAEAREQLAACYRLVAHFGMDDLIYTHASCRVPGEPDAFLINPFGLMFREITPANLVKVGWDGRALAPSDWPANVAGFVIHGAVLRARPDVQCVIHTHTRAGVALSCLEEGLLPISQFAIEFDGRVGSHDYEGLALRLDEQARLAHSLGPSHVALILRNHGLLAVGASVPAAFYLAYYLEQSARVQMDVLATNRPFVTPPAEVRRASLAEYTSSFDPPAAGARMWPSLLRLLDSAQPGWRG